MITGGSSVPSTGGASTLEKLMKYNVKPKVNMNKIWMKRKYEMSAMVVVIILT